MCVCVCVCAGDDVSSGRQTRLGHHVSDCGGRTLAPPGEFERLICAATAAMWAVATITIAAAAAAMQRRCCAKMVLIMELHRHTPVNWFVSPIYLVGVPSALPGPKISAVRQTVYCRRLDLPSRRTHHLQQSAPPLSTFRQRLRTFLFPASVPDSITDAR